MHIRTVERADAAVCLDVYHDAILNGTGNWYQEEAAQAWARDMDLSAMRERIAAGNGWLAEGADGATGFIVVGPHGHLDLFFVSPEARDDGVAAALYDHMLIQAPEPVTTCDASHLARRFLEKRGWSVVARETVHRDGQPLTRFRMLRQPA